MKQPYTYSMPETFLKDKNVPARWRVLGVINGFILNGGCFYGSNEWLMEQLGCSQQTISSAFSELEALGEIRTERTKRTRKVYKTSRDTNQLVSEVQAGSSRDPSQLVPNSVSNSESINGVSLRSTDTLEIVEVSEEDSSLPGESAKRPRVSGDKRKAYDELIAWSEKERGFPFLKTARGKQYAAFKIANENGITRDELIERWEEMSTEKFWKQNGYDWMNVVTSFNTKRV